MTLARRVRTRVISGAFLTAFLVVLAGYTDLGHALGTDRGSIHMAPCSPGSKTRPCPTPATP